ncbi:MAG: hypothetical protein IKY66_00300 [Bacteroidales bacterium]|nr:hypothetical protein [Bacteroidales bacterium]
MKNCITLVLFSALCVACATARQAAPSEKIITETRIETVYKTDTVLLEIPKIVEKVVTKDTVSALENDYAKSKAVISDGLLTHSLETKPVQKPVEVQTKIVYRDSVIVKDNVIIQTVEVEKELTGWQTFKMKTGGFALGIIVLLIVCVILYFVKPLNLFKL